MNTASLFGLEGPDLIVILLIALLLFGAKKLPELFRAMGETAREFGRIFAEAISKRARAHDASGTIFGLVAVITALVFFLLVVSARLSGL